MASAADDTALSGPPLFRNCTSAYLDIGANKGVKIEEVLAGRHDSFARFFNPAGRSQLCVVGFEPNPSHTAPLRAIESRHRAAGRRVTIIPAAISDSNGQATFWSDQDFKAGEWGSSLLRWQREMTPRHTSAVRTVALDWLMRTHVEAAAPRLVVVKLDIEGAEYDALPPALDTFCRSVDVLLLEMHKRFFKRSWHGHRPGFSTNLTKVETLVRMLEQLPKRQPPCRTRWVAMGSVERENAHLARKQAPPPAAARRPSRSSTKVAG